MLKLLAAAILLCAVPVLAEDITFKKDVKQYVSKGDKTEDHDATLTIGDEALTVARKGAAPVVVPFAGITGATYDRRVRQRKIMGLPAGGGYSPKVQHVLTVQYKTEAGAGFVELELGKDIAARVVSTLETRSGKPVEKIAG